MLCHRDGEHLEAWTSQAENSPVSELRTQTEDGRRARTRQYQHVRSCHPNCSEPCPNGAP